jgi:hypothetical protein
MDGVFALGDELLGVLNLIPLQDTRRGAPQVGFSATIRKISSRTSLLRGFLPTAFRACEIQLQYCRKPVGANEPRSPG